MRKFYFVSSSHLDREWYQSYEDFRIHIADIFFRVFDLLEKSDSFCVFMIDGQMSVVEDFLEIYPEQFGLIRDLAQKDKLILGPWYTQPDEFLVDGESHIRNLEIGKEMAKKFGNVMHVGYLPDSFGHISQMPQILNGFGIEKAFIMRGVEKQRNQEFLWTSPDGSCVKTIQNIYGNCNITITPDTKEHGTGILQTAEEIKARLEQFAISTECSTLSDRKLVTYCNDHSAPSVQFDSIMAELTEEGFDVRVGSLEEYFDTIPWDQVAAHIDGELREGEDIPLLRETAVSRPYLKRENSIAQKKLIHQAEPMMVLAQLQGHPLSGAFLTHAWKLLLQNHAHDSICGCSINDVHDEMMMRYRKLEQIADNQIMKAGNALLDTLVLPSTDDGTAAVLIVNTSGVSCDYVEASIFWPAEANYQSFCIYDADGNNVAYQIIDNIEEHRITSDIDRVQHFQHMTGYRILIPVANMPQCGYLLYHVQFSEEVSNGNGTVVKKNVPELENEYLHICFHENGTFSVTDKTSGKCYEELHYFLDDGTNGDVYAFHEVCKDTPIDSRDLHWEIEQRENGPLVQSVVLTAKMFLPSCMIGEEKRSEQLVENEISYCVSLKKNARQVEIHLCVDNQAQDHRLRLMLPSYVNTRVATSDAPFSFEDRVADQFPDYHPMQSFVQVRDPLAGIAFLSRGIHQYQLLQDEANTLAITLHHGRSQLYKWLAWKDTRFDGIQCLGKNEFRYAIYFCNSEDTSVDIHSRARAFNCEPLVFQKNTVLPKEERVWHAVTVKAGDIQLSALRVIQHNCVELRVFNPTISETSVHLQFGFKAKAIRKVDLSGKTLEEYSNTSEIVFSHPPAKIYTFRFDL